MRSHRLDRLTRLTHGAALVGLGAFAAACNNEPKHTNAPDPNGSHEPIHVNATADPTPPPSTSATAPIAVNATAPPASASAPPQTPPATSGSVKPSLTPHINAPPPGLPTRTNG